MMFRPMAEQDKVEVAPYLICIYFSLYFSFIHLAPKT